MNSTSVIKPRTKTYYDIIELEDALRKIGFKESISSIMDWENGQEKMQQIYLAEIEALNSKAAWAQELPKQKELVKALRQLGIEEKEINVLQWW